jgi:hypothetical protein
MGKGQDRGYSRRERGPLVIPWGRSVDVLRDSDLTLKAVSA